MRIVAIGGGGFSSDNLPYLDDYILAAVGSDRPRVGFLGTASGDDQSYRLRFYRTFNRRGLAVCDIDLFDQDGRAAQMIAELDVIYVGGGNTVNLLAIWRTHGLVEPLRAAYQRGATLCGVSAGAMCWFAGGVTDSYGPLRALPDGLGFVTGSFCPHYDEPGRRPAFHEAISAGLADGYAADNSVAISLVDGEVVEAVSTQPDRYAYRVWRQPDGGVTEQPLPTRLLRS